MNYSQGSKHISIVYLWLQYTPFSKIREQKVTGNTSDGYLGFRAFATLSWPNFKIRSLIISVSTLMA